jgi:hypothetical protein
MNAPPSLPEPQTVIVTTKNTASLTLGIIAIVVGVASSLVGWIPFLGLLAMPTAIIGLLLAGIGFVIAFFKGGKGIGLPLLGGGICVAAFILPILSTGSTSVAITKAVADTSKEVAAAQQSQESALAKVKAAYIQMHLDLYDVQAKYMDSVLDGKVPGVLLKLRNTGDRSVDKVKVTVTFKDASGVAIHDEDYFPVSVSDFSFGDNKPLKPGYVWQMESGKFYSAKSVPSEWQEGSVEAKITDIQFSKN